MNNKALIVVDVQNDFCPGGLYPVPNGNEIVDPINKLIDYARNKHWFIAFSRDWHPVNMPGTKHCIQNTEGAKFHPLLKILHNDIVISKGITDLGVNHYSAFNGEDIKLLNLLKDNKIQEVYVVGLAYDYCVKNTALDAKKYGFNTNIVEDATRGIFKKFTIDELQKDLDYLGIKRINSKSVIK